MSVYGTELNTLVMRTAWAVFILTFIDARKMALKQQAEIS